LWMFDCAACISFLGVIRSCARYTNAPLYYTPVSCAPPMIMIRAYLFSLFVLCASYTSEDLWLRTTQHAFIRALNSDECFVSSEGGVIPVMATPSSECKAPIVGWLLPSTQEDVTFLIASVSLLDNSVTPDGIFNNINAFICISRSAQQGEPRIRT
jgi:hypothetical protein